MKLYALDFETYFDDEYSLKKLTTEEYVRDKRFEAHGAAIVGKDIRQWMNAKQLKEQLEAWQMHLRRGGEPIALCAHHAHFDGLILNHHFGFRPPAWLCTLSMGRVLFGSGLKLGLDSLAGHFGLSPKSVPYEVFRGKHWNELNAWEQSAIAEGCLHDAELTLQICLKMLSGEHSTVPYPFPTCEIPVVDLTVRMFTEPTLIGDLDALGAAWTAENDARNALFERLSEAIGQPVDEKMLRADAQFALVLEALGVEPEMKTTAKGNEKYAFAKSDPFIQNLIESYPDEDIALAVEARLKAHSSIYKTRAERFGWMAVRGGSTEKGGPIPVYLSYAAAHTRRWGGGDKANWQNLPRPDPYKLEKGALRRAIKSEEFYVGKIDLSQIECRILNTIAGQWDVVEKFRHGVDIYSELASLFYGRPVSKAQPAERGTGKQLELSCGYGAGGATIVRTARSGAYGPPVRLTPEQGVQARDLYRGTHRYVVNLWRDADIVMLPALVQNRDLVWPLSPKGCSLVFKNKRVFHPCGLWLDYQSLEQGKQLMLKDGRIKFISDAKLSAVLDARASGEALQRLPDWYMDENNEPQIVGARDNLVMDPGAKVESYTEGGFTYKVRSVQKNMYGGRFIENIVQWLASMPIRHRMVQINRELGFKIPLTVHDDVFMLVPRTQEGIDKFERAKQIMSAPLDWLPECPIACEGELMDALDK